MRKLRLVFSVLPLVVAALACNVFETGIPTRIAPTPTRVAILPTPTFFLPTIYPTFPPMASPIPPTWGPPGPTLVPPPTGQIPGCTPRADWRGTYVIQPYDTLFDVALSYNLTTDEMALGNCLANPSLIHPGQVLRVPGGSGGGGGGCTTPWFFALNPGLPETGTCPFEYVIASPAAGQDFEGGRAYYYAAAGPYFQPMVYVVYNDGTFQQFTDTYTPVVNLPGIFPPPGRVAPVRAIGKVWFENDGVRQKLGWAYAPENDFGGRRQRTLNSNVFFIDHGIRNTVIRVDLSRGAWVVGGGY